MSFAASPARRTIPGMPDPYFTDPERSPDEKAILAAVGPAAPAWRALFDNMHAAHPDLAETWRYYADAKGWLLKVTRKSTTVFWLSVQKGGFRVSFYFPERLKAALLHSELSPERKAEIRGTAPDGKTRAVRITFGTRRGVQDVMTLIALKKTLR